MAFGVVNGVIGEGDSLCAVQVMEIVSQVVTEKQNIPLKQKEERKGMYQLKLLLRRVK